MSTNLKQQIIDAGIFQGVFFDLFPSARTTFNPNQIRVCCPFHDDENPSLSVNTKDGLFNCFACGAKGNAFDLYMKVKGCDFKTALHDLADLAGITRRLVSNEKPKVVATFYYHSAGGAPIYWKKRFEPGFDGKRAKDFVFYHHDDQGREVKGRGHESVLYNLRKLAELPDGEPVFFVEGEGCADVLIKWDLCGTTFDSGGQSRTGHCLEGCESFFKGREVYILPDNDRPGEEYAANIAQHLTGVAKTVKVLRLPGLPKKGDIIDWLCALGERE